jgi:hypothetical protein
MYDRTILETVDFHRMMLADEARMQSYLRAILKAVRPGDVVLDIGCGTGILAYFACMAGARLVYAVEQDPIVELARAICRQNGFQDRVVFLNDWSDQVELPEPVNVIVTETLGNIGFEEGIVGWIIDAKERLLAKDGKIIPHSIEMMVAPTELPNGSYLLDGWTKQSYTLDFSPVDSLMANNLVWNNFSSNSFLSPPATVIRSQLATATSPDIAGEGLFVANRDGVVEGLGCWFEAELFPGITISNEPQLGNSNWTQIFLPLECPIPVSGGDQLHVNIQAIANGAHWQWQVSNGHTENGQSVQSTLSGQFLEQAYRSNPNRKPVRNIDGEVDLFILRMMDGSTTVEEITRRTIANFSLQFNSFEDAQKHVYGLSELYSHQSNDGSQAKVEVLENPLPDSSGIKIKEV